MALTEIAKFIKQLVLLNEKVDRQADDMVALARQLQESDRELTKRIQELKIRLVRMETIVEMATAGREKLPPSES